MNLPRVAAVVDEGINAGLHVGAQIYASINGGTVADMAVGLARPETRMMGNTLMPWLSCGKPVAAVAIGQLWERGKLELDDRVAKNIPEFSAGGKEAITIRHLLTHTSGIRQAAMPWETASWEAIIARICAAPIEAGWVPGKKAGYHLASSWFLLGELVRRLDGRVYEKYVREEIFLPIGMNDSWIGMPAEQFVAYGDRMGRMYDTHSPPPRLGNTDEQAKFAATQCNPGASGRGPARELCWFYEMLLGGGIRGGKRILSPQTVSALTAPHRRGMFDYTFQHVMDWGLGFMADNQVNGADVSYSFGRGSSQRTFGHGGSQSSISFADPESGLAAVIIFNGRPGEEKHQPRMRRALEAMEEDLRSSRFIQVSID